MELYPHVYQIQCLFGGRNLLQYLFLGENVVLVDTGIAETYVDIYRSTLRYFEGLEMEVLYSGHWPVMRCEAIRDFIAESRQTVELFDRVILENLGRQFAGLTLKQLIDIVANAVGDWPKDSWTLAMFPVKGHMDRSGQLRKVHGVPDSDPAKWQLA